MPDHSVIVVGGGPVGLTAALFLGRAGIDVLVLERLVEAYEDPRAATFHPPTLEMYEECGITADLLARGIETPLWQYRDKVEGLVAEFDLGILADETRFPFRLQCEQHKLVDMLTDKIADLPNVEIRRGTPVEGVEDKGAHVAVRTAQGPLTAAFVVGADGGRSVVRKTAGIGFEGFTFPEQFLVITTTHDFATDGYAYSSYVSDPEEWAAVFKVPGPDGRGRWRMTSATDPDAPEDQLLSEDYAQGKITRFLPREEDYDILHTNLYRVHQRVASTFRKLRILLAGDAAHVNNPLGGMGMNFGIHDAVNLSEKLGAHLLDGAPDSLLDLYDRQRRHVADRFLQGMTIRNKAALEEKDPARRRDNLDKMRRTAADRELARAHLLRSSMIESVRVAAGVS